MGHPQRSSPGDLLSARHRWWGCLLSDIAIYHKVFEVGSTPILEQPNQLSHLCYKTADGFTVVDVWAGEAAFAQFGEVIGPAAVRAGLDPKPQVFPGVGEITQSGARTLW